MISEYTVLEAYHQYLGCRRARVLAEVTGEETPEAQELRATATEHFNTIELQYLAQFAGGTTL